MAPLKVLICGGGIAGPALAFWLSKLGYDVTVVERFSCLRASGQQIDLRGPGIQAMKRMGLEQVFRSKSIDEIGTQFVDSSGRQRGFFPVNKTGKGQQGFTTGFEIMRGDMCRILYDATKDRVKYIFDTSISSFQQHDDVIDVQFSNGTKDRFDLLVGADGQGSRTRRMMLEPGSPDPYHSLHMYVAYFTTARQNSTERIATTYLGTKKRMIFTRSHNSTTTQTYLIYPDDSDQLKGVVNSTPEEQKRTWAELYKGAGWNSEQIVQAMQDDSITNDFYTHEVAQVRMNSWSQGRVVLVGDAAYCPSPLTGMGTTSGLVGAYVLAGEIAKHLSDDSRGIHDSNTDGAEDPLVSALEAYDNRFRPFVTQVQTLGKGLWVPSSSWAIAVCNFLIGIFAFLRIDYLSRFVLREDVTWDMPEYAELAQLEISE